MQLEIQRAMTGSSDFCWHLKWTCSQGRCRQAAFGLNCPN